MQSTRVTLAQLADVEACLDNLRQNILQALERGVRVTLHDHSDFGEVAGEAAAPLAVRGWTFGVTIGEYEALDAEARALPALPEAARGPEPEPTGREYNVRYLDQARDALRNIRLEDGAQETRRLAIVQAIEELRAALLPSSPSEAPAKPLPAPAPAPARPSAAELARARALEAMRRDVRARATAP